MTECDNAEIRDVLPDYVAETLSVAEMSRISMHVAECGACHDEVALLGVARSARPQAVHIDVAGIVARIGKPRQADRVGILSSPTVAVARTSTVQTSSMPQRAKQPRRNVWQFAAAVAVVAIGGLSVVVARSGSAGLSDVAGLDSAQLSDIATGASQASPLAPPLESGPGRMPPMFEQTIPLLASAERVASDAKSQSVVSVGDLSVYTDAELQRMLDRLDKWDGATSSEVMPTMPLAPVGARGAKQ